MEEEKIGERLSEEIARIGEDKKVIAERVGASQQTITNATKGYFTPSFKLLYQLKSVFPRFDVEYIFTGVRSEEVPSHDYVKRLESENEQLKGQVDDYRFMLSTLRGKLDGVDHARLPYVMDGEVDRSFGNALLCTSMSSVAFSSFATV
jgi:DNA-binding XRE family transcriptional regulator